MQRIRVDFPHPEGPMIAVTARSSTSRLMSSIARFEPYHAERFWTWTFAVTEPHPQPGIANEGGGGRRR